VDTAVDTAVDTTIVHIHPGRKLVSSGISSKSTLIKKDDESKTNEECHFEEEVSQQNDQPYSPIPPQSSPKNRSRRPKTRMKRTIAGPPLPTDEEFEPSPRYSPTPRPPDIVERFQQDIEARAYNRRLREIEKQREQDPEASFKPDLSKTRDVNNRRLRESKKREKMRYQNSMNTNSKSEYIEKTSWEEDKYEGYGENDGKQYKTGKKRDSYSHYTRSANHNFQNQNIDRGRSGDIYYRENDEEYDSREAFYDDIELDPLEDTFQDDYTDNFDNFDDDDEKRAIEDEELAAIKRHDSFEKRLDGK
jgi:hypothetical protein